MTTDNIIGLCITGWVLLVVAVIYLSIVEMQLTKSLAAIRKHRDVKRDDRCRDNDYALYEALPEGLESLPVREAQEDAKLTSKHQRGDVWGRFRESLPEICEAISRPIEHSSLYGMATGHPIYYDENGDVTTDLTKTRAMSMKIDRTKPVTEQIVKAGVEAGLLVPTDILGLNKAELETKRPTGKLFVDQPDYDICKACGKRGCMPWVGHTANARMCLNCGVLNERCCD